MGLSCMTVVNTQPRKAATHKYVMNIATSRAWFGLSTLTRPARVRLKIAVERNTARKSPIQLAIASQSVAEAYAPSAGPKGKVAICTICATNAASRSRLESRAADFMLPTLPWRKPR